MDDSCDVIDTTTPIHGLRESEPRIDAGICALRAWTRHDRDSLVHHADNRRIWRNMLDVFPHPYTEADAEAWLTRVESQQPRLEFAIDVEGAAVGGIGLIPLSGNFRMTCQLGYWLGESYWGRGIASAAVTAIVRHAFDVLPFVRIEAGVFAWNGASMRVLEKAGFVCEGVLRQSAHKDGRLVDRTMYALTRDMFDGSA